MSLSSWTSVKQRVLLLCADTIMVRSYEHDDYFGRSLLPETPALLPKGLRHLLHLLHRPPVFLHQRQFSEISLPMHIHIEEEILLLVAEKQKTVTKLPASPPVNISDYGGTYHEFGCSLSRVLTFGIVVDEDDCLIQIPIFVRSLEI
jgi:hypothetical protein